MGKTILEVNDFRFQEEVGDPFLVRMHHLDYYPRGNENQGVPKELLPDPQPKEDFDLSKDWRMYYGKEVPGFPAHPHRGFETVTIVLQGYVDHGDSAGQSGRYGMGDVQWMTAGKGMQHSEMFPLVHEDKENTLELFQVWLNLPKRSKFVEPNYKMLWEEEIPELISKNDHGKVTKTRIISGSYKNTRGPKPTPDSWANNPENHVGIYISNLEPKASFTLPKVSSTLNRRLYYFEGEDFILDGNEFNGKKSFKLSGDEEITLLNGNKKARLLVLEGEPINEPVVSYGPFVMNTMEEIQQAYDDYQETQFGGWPWETTYPVSPIDIGRYAKIEEKDTRPPSKFF